MSGNHLSDQLRSLNEKLSEAEQANFKLLLGLAAGGLAPDFAQPPGQEQQAAFDTVSATLARLQPYGDRISPDGVAFRGRPALMSDEMLASLQAEARDLRPSALRFDEHFLGCGAPIANKLATSDELVSLVREHAGEVSPTGIASFLYYDEPGQGIDPHIDTDIFSLNVLLMLDHQRPAGMGSGPGSVLVMFPPHAEPQQLDLEPGEMVIFFAGSIAHGRKRIAEGESVSILTFGFQPLSVPDDTSAGL
jgi:hypothetical protein